VNNLPIGCYAAASRLGLEPATTRSPVRRPTTKPPRHPWWLSVLSLFNVCTFEIAQHNMVNKDEHNNYNARCTEYEHNVPFNL